MNDLVATLGVTDLSKPQISEMAKNLDFMVEDFRSRPFRPGPRLNISCDALTKKSAKGGVLLKSVCCWLPELTLMVTGSF